MKRKEIRERDKPGFWPIIILMVGVILLSGIFYGTVYGAAYNKRVHISTNPRHDSSSIVLYRNGVMYDSSVVDADTTLTLDDIYNWSYDKIDYWDGSTSGEPDPSVILPKAIATSLGSGINAWTIYVADSADTSFVNRAKVYVTTMSGTPEAVDLTDTFGKVEFTTDLDSFIVRVSYPLGNDGGPDTMVVLADGQVDTTYLSFTMIPGAVSADFSTVFLIYHKNGIPIKNALFTVSNSNVATDTVNNTIIGPFYDETKTDSMGVAAISVPKSYLYHDIEKSYYQISLYYKRTAVKRWSDVFVPDQDSLRIEVED